MSGTNGTRQDLLDCFQQALQAVNGGDCVKAYFARQPQPWPAQLSLVAIGKAALSMAEGACEVLGSRIVDGLIITKAMSAMQIVSPHPRLRLIESAHPVPDERSLAAGRALLDFLQDLPAERAVVFLISGGSSALVEVLPPGMALADLQAMNTSLLAGGMGIGEINGVRRAVSMIKGGRLLNYLGERPVFGLLLSDVPGNDPAVIGSGLLVPSQQAIDLPAGLPDSIRELLPSAAGQGAAPRRAGIEMAIVGDNQMARAAAADCAEAKGYAVWLYPELLTTDVHDVAAQIMMQLAAAAPGIHIWGGEPTLCLPPTPGRGGRNQHLALLLADRIKQQANIQILVAATDGSDGPTEDAGALVDGQTITRGEQEGLLPGECLQAADAGRFLEASGDLISTGSTGSNVMDLMIACKS